MIKKELEYKVKVLEKVIYDIWWMAKRYANGRRSYAPGMYNDAMLDAMSVGMRFKSNDTDTCIFAEDGDLNDSKHEAIYKANLILERDIRSLKK